MTPAEKEIRDGYEKQRDKEQEKRDLMTDGSASYWQAVRYFKERGAEYLKGDKAEKGMKYEYSTGLVHDERVKGELVLEYVFA